MISNFSIIVSSCDKFSDLWSKHFELLEMHWKGELPPIYLVTDKETDYSHNGVSVLVFDGDMPVRLKKACQKVKTKYVLITLDDYYVISDVYEDKMHQALDKICEMDADYLSIYNRRYCKEKYYTSVDDIRKIDLSNKYAVALYPAIWNKDFFVYCVDEDGSPWSFEPKLTDKAKEYNASCYYNISGLYDILDVVRKGRILRKAHRYFKKHNIDIGDRPLTNWKTEIKQTTADIIYWYLPKWAYRFTRRIAIKLGMHFYSDE